MFDGFETISSEISCNLSCHEYRKERPYKRVKRKENQACRSAFTSKIRSELNSSTALRHNLTLSSLQLTQDALPSPCTNSASTISHSVATTLDCSSQEAREVCTDRSLFWADRINNADNFASTRMQDSFLSVSEMCGYF